MKRAVTLQDIAHKLSVSKATVSLALRGDKRVGAETRELVKRTAEELGYRPDATMTQLMERVRSTTPQPYQATLAVINTDPNRVVFDFVTSYKEWLDGVKERADMRGYKLDSFWLHEPGMTEDRLIEILRSRNIEGVLVPATNHYNSLPGQFGRIWELFCCVVMGIRHTTPILNFASNDQYATGLDAVTALHELGYNRVGLAMLEIVHQIVDGRFVAGYETGRRLCGCDEDIPPLIFPDRKRGVDLLHRWIKKHKPQAILGIDRDMIRWVRDFGYDVPGDIALAHLDHHADMVGWAGMEQHNRLVGSAAVDLLINQISFGQPGPPAVPTCTLVSSTWVPGPSVASRRKQGKICPF